MRWVLCLALVVLGLGVRVLPWAKVFSDDGVVNLLPADSHYYVRFAHLQRAAFPRWVDEDPYINFPFGARILWPPFHTYSVALAESFTRSPEAGAAWVGVAWSLVGLIALTVALRRSSTVDVALALFVLAVAPIAVQAGALGNADHHVHEVFGAALGTAWLAGFLEAPTRARAILLGLFVGSARFFTTVGVLAGPLLAMALVGAQLVGVRPSVRRLGELALAAVGTSFVLVLAFGRLTVEFETVSLFGPLSILTVLSVPIALAGFFERTRWRWVGILSLVLGGALAGQVVRAAGELVGQDPMGPTVSEAHPLWHPAVDAIGLFHALLLLAPLVVVGLTFEARARRSLVGIWVPLVVLLAMGVLQIRFFQAASGALAVALGPSVGALRLLPQRSRGFARVLGGALLLSLLTTIERPEPESSFFARCRPTMEWLKAHSPTPSDPFDTHQVPKYGVLGAAFIGHAVELWAERPTLITTFSQASWHLAAIEVASKLLGSRDDEAAWREAQRLRLAYVVLLPNQQVYGVSDDQLEHTLARRLYQHDGAPHFQLIYTSAERTPQGLPQLKVFQVESRPDPE